MHGNNVTRSSRAVGGSMLLPPNLRGLPSPAATYSTILCLLFELLQFHEDEYYVAAWIKSVTQIQKFLWDFTTWSIRSGLKFDYALLFGFRGVASWQRKETWRSAFASVLFIFGFKKGDPKAGIKNTGS